MKSFGLLAALAVGIGFIAADAQAQTGTARGKVVDEKGQPIEGAVVSIEYLGGVSRKMDTKTNKKGEFTQVGLQPGNYKVTASKEGFQATYIETKINLGDPTYLPDFKLAAKGAAQQAAVDELNTQFKKGFEAAQAGKHDEAETIFKDLIAKNPTVPQIHYNLGYVYAQKKDWPAAEGALKKALELKPDYGEATMALIAVYDASGQKDKALALANEGASSNDPKALLSLGIMYINSGETDKAREALIKAEAAEPANAEIQYFLGTIAVQQGKTEEAVARLEKYLSMGPKNPQNKATAEQLLAALKPKP